MSRRGGPELADRNLVVGEPRAGEAGQVKLFEDAEPDEVLGHPRHQAAQQSL